MDWVAGHLDLAWIQHPIIQRVIAARIAAHHSHNWRGVPALLDAFDGDEHETARNLIIEAVAEEHRKVDLGQNIIWGILQLKHDYISRQLSALQLLLTQPELSEEESINLTRQKMELSSVQKRLAALRNSDLAKRLSESEAQELLKERNALRASSQQTFPPP